MESQDHDGVSCREKEEFQAALSCGTSGDPDDVDAVSQTSCPPSWYAVPPNFECTIEELESITLDRLHTLKSILGILGGLEVQRDQLNFSRTIKRHVAESDSTGHWLLRLAACADEDLASWWINAERRIFRQRLERVVDEQNHTELLCLLVGSLIDYMPCQFNEFDVYGRHDPQFYPTCDSSISKHEQVVEWWKHANTPGACGEVAIKLPFEHAIPLVKRRDSSVLMIKGDAIVLMPRWIDIFCHQFKVRLRNEVLIAQRTLPTLLQLEESRIAVLIQTLRSKMDQIRMLDRGNGPEKVHNLLLSILCG